MKFRAILFDVGSVLVQDTDTSYRDAWAERLDVSPDTLGDLVFASDVAARAAVGEASYQAVWEHVAEELGLDAETLAQLERDFWRGDQVDETLAGFLRSLRGDYITGLLSNAWPNARQRFTEEFGLADAVDVMIISAEVGVCKPDPRIYEMALERVGVAAETVIFLDDLIENVIAAKALGICALHYQTTPRAMAAITRLLDR